MILIKLSLFAAVFVSLAQGQTKNDFSCSLSFRQYKLDDEPIYYGLSGGFYAPGKRAYIGISVWMKSTFNSGRIQLNPPGIWTAGASGSRSFVNDTTSIWFLRPRSNQKFRWVPSSNGADVPFGVEFTKNLTTLASYVGRIRRNNNTIALGIVLPHMNTFYYIDENSVGRSTTSGYEVLTCRSSRRESFVALPKFNFQLPPNVDSRGCINNWQQYKNDDAPAKNGVVAGDYGCGNTAYVGKGKSASTFIPGRIQTVAPLAGLYSVSKKLEIFTANGSFYLVDNPNYTYRWTSWKGEVPANAVLVRNDVGPLAFPVTRGKVNGRIQIGMLFDSVSIFPAANGNGDETHASFDLLVCDPWPKFKCGQEWKKYAGDNAPSVDGFNMGTYRDSIDAYVGRGSQRGDFNVGRLQIAPSTAAGVYYLDNWTGAAVFDNTSAEYLVKNSAYTYQWIASNDGVAVKNALELSSKESGWLYIGATNVNGVEYIGEIRPGAGLFYVRTDGIMETVSSYSVLTCTSPDEAMGVDEGSESKCGSKREFEEEFDAQRNEDTCSYGS